MMRKFTRLCIAAGFLLLIGSMAINWLQARRILSLQDTIDELASRGELSPGSEVPPLEVIEPSGRKSSLTYDGGGQATILYVFSPSCQWCERNGPGVAALAAGAAKSYRVVGISLSSAGLGEFVTEHQLAFPAFTISADSRRAYRLEETPEVIVVSPNGKVVSSWKGAFLGRTKEEMERFFSVRLPEI